LSKVIHREEKSQGFTTVNPAIVGAPEITNKEKKKNATVDMPSPEEGSMTETPGGSSKMSRR